MCLTKEGFGMRFMRAAVVLALSPAFYLAQVSAAYAHEGWFVEQGQHSGEYFSLDWIMLLVTVGAVMFVASATTIDRLTWSRKLRELCDQGQRCLPAGIEWRVVAILSGAMLIANSLMGVYLAPNLVLPSWELVVLGGVVQAVVGLL